MGSGGVEVYGYAYTLFDLQPKGCWFESTSSHCVATLDKLLTQNCLVGRRRETTSLISSPGGVKANEPVFGQKTIPRQQKFRAMNGAHLANAIRGELGYAHWPQLGTQFIALLGTKFGAH